MAKFTLDDIRAAAEREYGSTEIELADGKSVTLVNMLRLPKAKRAEFERIQEEMSAEPEEGEDGPDHEALMAECLRVAADNPAGAEALLDWIGEDMALLATIFKIYAEETQTGEASASAA